MIIKWSFFGLLKLHGWDSQRTSSLIFIRVSFLTIYHNVFIRDKVVQHTSFPKTRRVIFPDQSIILGSFSCPIRHWISKSRYCWIRDALKFCIRSSSNFKERFFKGTLWKLCIDVSAPFVWLMTRKSFTRCSQPADS